MCKEELQRMLNKLPRLLIIPVLFLTLMGGNPAWGEWKKVTSDAYSGNTFYLDFERLSKRGRYVYYWLLQNSKKRDVDGIMSVKMYTQGDCEMFRFKQLSFVYHRERMGGGPAEVEDSIKKHWYYPTPDSPGEIILKSACRFAK
jgi:hypothetical protein